MWYRKKMCTLKQIMLTSPIYCTYRRWQACLKFQTRLQSGSWKWHLCVAWRSHWTTGIRQGRQTGQVPLGNYHSLHICKWGSNINKVTISNNVYKHLALEMLNKYYLLLEKRCFWKKITFFFLFLSQIWNEQFKKEVIHLHTYQFVHEAVHTSVLPWV